MSIKIWTLNAAESLLPNPTTALIANYNYIGDGGTRSVDPWVFTGGEIEDGLRKPFDNPALNYTGNDPIQKFFWTNNSNPHNLMPDTEYFVPIAAKCIGSRFDRITDFPNLEPIKNYYYGEWKKAYPDIPGVDYKVFWDKGCGPGKLSKMITKNYTGYYDILKQSGDKHILIGYSLGGLVARYLAWLDEYVFKENIIKGIITITGPNFGSPLANPDNRQNITDQIIIILMGIVVQLLISKKPLSDALINKLKGIVSFSDVISGLRYLISITPPDQEKELLGKLIAAFKWLSGLDANDPDCKAISFVDLNIMNIEKNPASVLASVNNNTLTKIVHGALLNGDNRIGSLLNSFTGILTILIPSNIIQMVTDNCKNNIMKETTSPINNQMVKDKIASYYSSSDIPALSHDFVIPSVYQKIDNGKDEFLKNSFNPRTNHLTGSKIDFPGGNLIPLRGMLRDMRANLKTQGGI